MARRVRFLRDFDHWPKRTVMLAFRKGLEGLVPEGAALAAIAAGAAIELAPQLTRPQEPEAKP